MGDDPQLINLLQQVERAVDATAERIDSHYSSNLGDLSDLIVDLIKQAWASRFSQNMQ